jgi:hypothetical protein
MQRSTSRYGIRGLPFPLVLDAESSTRPNQFSCAELHHHVVLGNDEGLHPLTWVKIASRFARLRHMGVIYASRALERPGDRGSTTFCGVHAWQVKANLLATSATRKDEHA